MENEIYTFKKEVTNLINCKEMKVWLAEKYGRRIEYLFKVGQEQFGPPKKIAENKKYTLFGQNIEEVKEELKELFKNIIDN